MQTTCSFVVKVCCAFNLVCCVVLGEREETNEVGGTKAVARGGSLARSAEGKSFAARRRAPASRARDTLREHSGRPVASTVGDLPSPFIYRGVWSWDAAYSGVGHFHWDAGLARGQIQIFLDRQLPSGLSTMSRRKRKTGSSMHLASADAGLGLWIMDRRNPDNST